MADRSLAEQDKIAIERFNRLYKESIERERRMLRHWEWRGGQLPPMSIEPMRNVRERLEHGQMTPEQRAMRKQWVMDQRLGPNEPVHIPELYPKNPIRRMLAAPWDYLFKAVEGVMGKTSAGIGRFYAPRLAIGFSVALAMYYHQKYYPSTWQNEKGWHVYSSKTGKFPGDTSWPAPDIKPHDDFNDRGLKSRSTHLDLKTSFVE